jgi:16S rRNA (guanine966-N2)-methyltransferase
MRIVGGRWAERILVSPGARVRPTSEGVRDQWLGRFEAEIREARVLDLFAGSGALGLEALSRGATSVDFVENGRGSLHALKSNVTALRARASSRIFKEDALTFLSRFQDIRYEIAFADPPYGSKVLDRVIQRWQEAPFSTVLSVEHASDHPVPGGVDVLLAGDTQVTFFRAGAG